MFTYAKYHLGSVCGATLDTGVSIHYTDTSRAIIGITATVMCSGLVEDYVVLSLCSKTCILDTVSTCCKVPSRFAGTSSPRPRRVICLPAARTYSIGAGRLPRVLAHDASPYYVYTPLPLVVRLPSLTPPPARAVAAAFPCDIWGPLHAGKQASCAGGAIAARP